MPGAVPQAADVDWNSVMAGQLITANAVRNVRAGPGAAYIVLDTVEPGESYILAGECRSNWCEIDHAGKAGWIYFSDLNHEGWEPTGPLSGPHLNWVKGGSGEVCFYDEPDYSGRSLCLSSGTSFSDLGTVGADNWISSIRVTGDISATLCRDADFRNYCIMAVQDQPHLDRFLDNQVTSITIH